MSEELAKKYVRIGGYFQLTMMMAYIVSLVLYAERIQWDSYWTWVSHAGAALFLYCLVVLYTLKRRIKGLVTSFPFSVTRHPMYTGLFLMDLAMWLPKPVSTDPRFFVHQAVFLVCMIIAAHFQEKETLARFGEEAERYYARTPRLFFLYPLMRRTIA